MSPNRTHFLSADRLPHVLAIHDRVFREDRLAIGDGSLRKRRSAADHVPTDGSKHDEGSNDHECEPHPLLSELRKVVQD